MNGFSRRWFSRRWDNPPELFGDAPDTHSLSNLDFLRARQRHKYGELHRRYRPPDLSMAGQPPELGPETQAYLRDMLLETATPTALAPRSERPLRAPVAPDLTYEDYKAQPPSLRFADTPPSEMSPYEVEEYADEMAASRKVAKAQRMQELYEQYQAEHPQPRMGVSEEQRGPRIRAIDMMRLGRGRVSPEKLAGIRQARWEKAPELFPAGEQFIPPVAEEDVSRFAGMLPPDLQAMRAEQQYRIEHPEAPTLPRYETTVERKIPGGKMIRKPITPPTQLDIEQARGRLAAEQARKAYWERPPTTTLSPIMRMVGEGLITLEEGKGLATKEKDDNLTEKDIISIMHTVERALATTYTPLNEPLGGEKYAERREYYAQQLEVYRNRLDQIRVGKKKGITEKSITATNPQTGERVISYDGGNTWQSLQ